MKNRRLPCVDGRQIAGTFTHYDSATRLALIGSLRRIYLALGLQRPAPAFTELLKK